MVCKGGHAHSTLSTTSGAGLSCRKRLDAQHVVAAHGLSPPRAGCDWEVHNVVRPKVAQPRSPVSERRCVAERGGAMEGHTEERQRQQHERSHQLQAINADVEVLRVVVLLVQVPPCKTGC